MANTETDRPSPKRTGHDWDLTLSNGVNLGVNDNGDEVILTFNGATLASVLSLVVVDQFTGLMSPDEPPYVHMVLNVGTERAT